MTDKKDILSEINRTRDLMSLPELHEQDMLPNIWDLIPDIDIPNPFDITPEVDISPSKSSSRTIRLDPIINLEIPWAPTEDLSVYRYVANAANWWIYKGTINVRDYEDKIKMLAADRLSDYVAKSEIGKVAAQYATFLATTYTTVEDWKKKFDKSIAGKMLHWLERQVDSVIWYWTEGPGGRFFRCIGGGFVELKTFCMDPSMYKSSIYKRVSKAIAKGDNQYLDDLSDAIKCGIGIALTALTVFTWGLFGVWGAVTLATIVGIGWYTFLATNATKVRIGFPSEDWEGWVFEQLKDLGIVNGIFRNLTESKKWWDAYPTSPKLKYLFIGSHGKAGNIITIKKKHGGSGHVQLFDEKFLGPIKPHVDSNTKVFFTACHGADDLVALKRASEYLGCNCYGCEGDGWGGWSCEYDAYKCKSGKPLLQDMKKNLPQDFSSRLIEKGDIKASCFPQNTDNIQSIQTFLVGKGIDIGTSGWNNDGIDGAIGNATAKGIATYLGFPSDVKTVKSLKSTLKKLGYSAILRGNNPGTWGGHTNNLISYLIAIKCSNPKVAKMAPELFPSDRTVKDTKGCIVVNKENWWLNYL